MAAVVAALCVKSDRCFPRLKGPLNTQVSARCAMMSLRYCAISDACLSFRRVLVCGDGFCRCRGLRHFSYVSPYILFMNMSDRLS